MVFSIASLLLALASLILTLSPERTAISGILLLLISAITANPIGGVGVLFGNINVLINLLSFWSRITTV